MASAVKRSAPGSRVGWVELVSQELICGGLQFSYVSFGTSLSTSGTGRQCDSPTRPGRCPPANQLGPTWPATSAGHVGLSSLRHQGRTAAAGRTGHHHYLCQPQPRDGGSLALWRPTQVLPGRCRHHRRPAPSVPVIGSTPSGLHRCDCDWIRLKQKRRLDDTGSMGALLPARSRVIHVCPVKVASSRRTLANEVSADCREFSPYRFQWMGQNGMYGRAGRRQMPPGRPAVDHASASLAAGKPKRSSATIFCTAVSISASVTPQARALDTQKSAGAPSTSVMRTLASIWTGSFNA